MNAIPFLLLTLSLPILGIGAAFHPSIRNTSLPARAAAALAFGAVWLTLAGMLLTAAGIRWSLPALAAVPLAVSLAAGLLWSRRPAAPFPPAAAGLAARRALFVIAAASLALLGWALVRGSATSVDYLFFWGVKSARFADVRGVDVELLRWPFFAHAVVDYPPLVPIVQAFGAAGRRPLSLADGALSRRSSGSRPPRRFCARSCGAGSTETRRPP